MDEFLLIFRRDYKTKDVQPSPGQLQEHLQKWQLWYGKLAEEDRLVRPQTRWDAEGRVVDHHKTVLNGPYAEIKESIGGVTIIRAASYEEATEIASASPILDLGGTVEIRKAM
nr:YciI family protein [uncultured Dyadobacter sp.]